MSKQLPYRLNIFSVFNDCLRRAACTQCVRVNGSSNYRCNCCREPIVEGRLANLPDLTAVDKSSIDMNAITKIQGLLNHSDQRVTMRYLGTYQQMFDKARESVSEFVLGKTDIHEIVAGNNYTIDDIVSKIDQLEKKLSN